ncbi:gliding motility protein GldN [Prevotella sp. E13-17]|uniref:type IX secretion system ring protein PorN/GldN n=1 Tax=Prevotella sp. E13-17 TaxID=2913616 RepID=UPI001EDA4347|nr:gliding motility protein GldN [Prevotella sp. E13-17]UKK51322.1 gliding motility protein GldN [Prevotella sp. E13-17]
MKKLLFLLIITLAGGSAMAQPKQRRNQQTTEKAQQQSGSQAMTQRMRIQYPTALNMPEDVVWRRDIYREIDLSHEANAGLYDPVEPVGKQMNLFTYIFKLALQGYIPVYEYRLDGNEVLESSAKIDMKTVLDNYHIFYEEKDGKIKVDNSDIPSSEVKMFYLKESAYYNQANSTFHIKPLALCPVMLREDDFGGEAAKYPLFWIKYSEVEPYLSRKTLKTSDINDAAVMNMDDYFTLNKYHGKIYKTANRLGKTLAQIAGNDTTKLSAEQKRIEKELENFRNGIFGDREKPVEPDSVSATTAKEKKTTTRRTRAATKKEKVSKTKAKSSSSGGSSAARVSVRRQRH